MSLNLSRRRLVARAGIASLASFAATPTLSAEPAKTAGKTFDRTTVEGTARYFQNSIRSGHVDAALSCFDSDAVYVVTPGTVVRGHFDIRKALATLVAMKPDLQAKRSLILEVGELASLVDEWTLKATLPGAKKLNLKGASSDILKKRTDGTWVYLVDNPYGAASLGKAA